MAQPMDNDHAILASWNMAAGPLAQRAEVCYLVGSAPVRAAHERAAIVVGRQSVRVSPYDSHDDRQEPDSPRMALVVVGREMKARER